MIICLLLLSAFTISSTWTSPSKHNSEVKRSHLVEQLTRIETQLNKSMSELFEKIDDNTLKIMNSLSFARLSRRDGKSSLGDIERSMPISFHRSTARICSTVNCSVNHWRSKWFYQWLSGCSKLSIETQWRRSCSRDQSTSSIDSIRCYCLQSWLASMGSYLIFR